MGQHSPLISTWHDVEEFFVTPPGSPQSARLNLADRKPSVNDLSSSTMSRRSLSPLRENHLPANSLPRSVSLESAASPERPRRDSMMAQQPITYTGDQLKAIGRTCAEHLPPASAVQAMFMYEMQRQTEAEQLFQHHMFRLARADHENEVKSRHIVSLETRIDKLEKDLAKMNVAAQIATSETRMVAHGYRVDKCMSRLDTVDESLAQVVKCVDELDREEMKIARTVHETAAKAPGPDTHPSLDDLDRLDSDIEQIYADNRDLWADRQSMRLLLNDARKRMDEMEAKIAELSTSPYQSFVSQRIPSPERRAYSEADSKQNSTPSSAPRKLSPVTIRSSGAGLRSFSPGKQWGH